MRRNKPLQRKAPLRRKPKVKSVSVNLDGQVTTRYKQPLKRSTKPMKHSPLKKVSKTMAAKLKLYSVQRKRFLEENPICPITGKPSVDIHHTKLRGKYLLDESTWIAVSREGHDMIHENPRWARENGYLF